METEMEWNEMESARVQQLFSEHFDFALSQLNSQCTKSGESDKELSYLYKEYRTKDARLRRLISMVAFWRCMHV